MKPWPRFRVLKRAHLIKLHDAAIVSWPAGKKSLAHEAARRSHGRPRCPGRAFWGMLFGLIFVTPLFGLAFGAAVGALGGSSRDYGIDDDFIRRVRKWP